MSLYSEVHIEDCEAVEFMKNEIWQDVNFETFDMVQNYNTEKNVRVGLVTIPESVLLEG